MDVSIIIVNYNTKLVTLNCLKSVFEQTKDIDFEVIVSDNGSKDGSIEAIKENFPQVILLENNANIGFGAANNRALNIAKGKYVLFLNSDTLLLNNAVKYFYDFWEEDSSGKLGALGCILQDEHGNVIHSGDSFPTYENIIINQKRVYKSHIKWALLKIVHLQNIVLKLLNRIKKDVLFSYEPGAIDYITGADLFMLNNSDARFDEKFILYYEETDLEKKLELKNLDRLLINTPKIVHLEKKRGLNFSISSFSSIQCQRSAILYSRRYLTGDTFELEKWIKKDWKNIYIKKLAEPYFKEFWGELK